jgi:hypothetical protein
MKWREAGGKAPVRGDIALSVTKDPDLFDNMYEAGKFYITLANFFSMLPTADFDQRSEFDMRIMILIGDKYLEDDRSRTSMFGLINYLTNRTGWEIFERFCQATYRY